MCYSVGGCARRTEIHDEPALIIHEEAHVDHAKPIADDALQTTCRLSVWRCERARSEARLVPSPRPTSVWWVAVL